MPSERYDVAAQEQTILIVSVSTELTDRLIELFERCDQANLRIYISRTVEDTELLLEHKLTSMIIVDTTTVGDLAFLNKIALHVSPRPALAIIEEGTAENLKAALRNGADDVFALSELEFHPELFCNSMLRQLNRVRLIEESRYLRESLERSLDELKADQHAAQQVQQNLLPPKESDLNNIHVEYLLRPSLLLSGDFVDSVALNEHLTLFYLADVSGHGASSALVTVLLKNMTYRLCRNYNRNSSFDILSPLKTLSRINKEILACGVGKHLTMFIGLIDSKTNLLTYAVGGHHPLPVLFQQGSARYIEGRGMPLGLFDEPMFEEKQLQLDPEFTITLFSDGILEVARGDTLEQKEDVLLEVCGSGYLSPDLIAKAIVAEELNAPDDVAIMTVSRKPL